MIDTFVSADLGKLQDFTVISVVNVSYYSRPAGIGVDNSDPDRRIPIFEVPLIERQQMPYMTSLKRMQMISQHPAIGAREQELIIDASGVGEAVLEMCADMRMNVTPIVITSGHSSRFEDGKYFVPRKEIVNALVVAYQSKRIRVARAIGEAAKILGEEMGYLRVKSRESGAETFESEMTTQHDDTVMSVGMAIWRAMQIHRLDADTYRNTKRTGPKDWDIDNWGLE